MKSYVREKKIYCGNYLEVDIYGYTDNQLKYNRSGRRSKRIKVTIPKQRNLNDKNARRYLTQLANSNFTEDDLHITATYKKTTLPKSIEEAEKNVTNYLRRINYARKKKGLASAKYIIVSEYKTGKDDEKPIRIHHHIIIDKGLSRDELEDLWSYKKNKRKQSIGFCNTDRLQPEGNGLEALCKYLTKNPNGKKRWRSSQSLIKPFYRTNDHKYSKRQLETLATKERDKEYWKKKYKGYSLIENEGAVVTEYNEITGWSVYLKFIKLQN